MPAETISVILATFNGASHLQKQLISLVEQSLLPTELLIGDDGSVDETYSIIEAFAATSPFTVRLLPASSRPLGTCMNFARLMQAAQGEYVLFCDQDDLWLPDKIECSLLALREMEKEYGRNLPCLVHTDLSVIDATDKKIAPSFWRYQYLDPRLSLSLNTALVQNVVTGCTVIMNRALVDAVLPLPLTGPLMHDWWLVVVALALGGRVGYLSRPTVQYRQHGANAVGAKRWSLSGVLTKMLDVGQIKQQLVATQMQAATLLQRHNGQLSASNRELAEIYATLSSLGPFAKRMNMWRCGIHKSGWQRTLGLYLYV